MNTTENNKKLAEFLEWEIQKDPTERFFGRYKNPIGTWYKEIDLAFHHDWNWLMEVVEKIESLEFDFAIYTGSSASIINTGNFPFKEIVSEGGKNKIEAVYNACVEFVEWYNKEQSDNALIDSIDEWAKSGFMGIEKIFGGKGGNKNS